MKSFLLDYRIMTREFKPLDEEDIYREMSPDDLERAKSLIGYLAVEDAITTDEAATLLARADKLITPLKEKSKVLAERRMARMALWKKAVQTAVSIAIPLSVVGGSGYGLASIYDYVLGATAQIRHTQEFLRKEAVDKEYRGKLEQTNTLGLASSASSFSGWSVRYPANGWYNLSSYFYYFNTH